MSLSRHHLGKRGELVPLEEDDEEEEEEPEFVPGVAQCGVCQKPLTNTEYRGSELEPMAVQCSDELSHVFHRRCIETWWTKDQCCPVCEVDPLKRLRRKHLFQNVLGTMDKEDRAFTTRRLGRSLRENVFIPLKGKMLTSGPGGGLNVAFVLVLVGILYAILFGIRVFFVLRFFPDRPKNYRIFAVVPLDDPLENTIDLFPLKSMLNRGDEKY